MRKWKDKRGKIKQPLARKAVGTQYPILEALDGVRQVALVAVGDWVHGVKRLSQRPQVLRVHLAALGEVRPLVVLDSATLPGTLSCLRKN